MTHNVTLVSATQYTDSSLCYTTLTTNMAAVTIQGCYDTIDYIPYVVSFIPVAYSFITGSLYLPLHCTTLPTLPPPSPLTITCFSYSTSHHLKYETKHKYIGLLPVDCTCHEQRDLSFLCALLSSAPETGPGTQ